MKILLFNGSPHRNGCTYTALSEVAGSLAKNDLETEIFQAGSVAGPGCQACGACRKVGHCVHSKAVAEISARLDEFDGYVFGAPVYYASAAGQLSAFCDALFYSSAAKLRYKPGAAVVSCRRGGSTAALDEINKYFTINCMPVVSSQYWNMVHGNTPEQVRQDLEGMQIMRQLGENMSWLLRCIELGQQAGIAPQTEPRVSTNFIR